MKVLVIDNETNIRLSIVELINAFCPQVTEIEQAEGVASGLKKIYEFNPDVVFTDVEMDDGTGMSMLSKLSNIPFQVIFITAYNKYAIDAFKFSAIDFLTKPVNPDELAKSMQRAEQALKNKSILEQVKVLNELKVPKLEKKIVLKDLESISVVKVVDILFCEASGIYTTFNLADKRQIVVSRNLKEFEEILEPYDFLRVHNSFLVNGDKISSFDKNDGGSLVLIDNSKIPVSQRKREVVLNFLKRFSD